MTNRRKYGKSLGFVMRKCHTSRCNYFFERFIFWLTIHLNSYDLSRGMILERRCSTSDSYIVFFYLQRIATFPTSLRQRIIQSPTEIMKPAFRTDPFNSTHVFKPSFPKTLLCELRNTIHAWRLIFEILVTNKHLISDISLSHPTKHFKVHHSDGQYQLNSIKYINPLNL